MLVSLPFLALLGHFVSATDDFTAGPPFTKEEKAEAAKLDITNQTMAPTFEMSNKHDNASTILESERNVLLGGVNRWPNRRIPLEIDEKFTMEERFIFARAADDIESVSCIRFVGKTAFDTDFLRIKKSQLKFECYVKPFGFQLGLGVHELVVERKCIQYFQILRMMFNVLGFVHEIQRPDRDNYIKVHWDKIKSSQIHKFFKIKTKDINSTIECDREKPEDWDKCFLPIFSDTFGEPYDFFSIMHFKPSRHAEIEEDTVIEPKYPTDVGGSKMSSIDIRKLNKAYCSNSPLYCHEVQRVTSTEEFRYLDAQMTNCRKWNLIAPDNMNIELQFTYFQFDKVTADKRDFIIIADGDVMNHTIIFEFDDYNRPSVQNSYKFNVSRLYVEMLVPLRSESNSEFFAGWIAAEKTPIDPNPVHTNGE